jgi:phage tail sheath protein FI
MPDEVSYPGVYIDEEAFHAQAPEGLTNEAVTALFIEESLRRGLQWVVFEPNDEPLWAQIRRTVGAFMNNLFTQGSFEGETTDEAYFVKCGRETTTDDDIANGVVNVVVGFAPLKPAEFVIVQLQQAAGGHT